MEGGHYSELPLCGEFALIARRVLVSSSLATTSDFLCNFFSCFKMTLFVSFLINNPRGGWSEKMVMKNINFMIVLIVKLTFRKKQLNCSPSLSRLFWMGCSIEFWELPCLNKNWITIIIMFNICGGLTMCRYCSKRCSCINSVITILLGRCQYYAHFMYEETEAGND